MLKGTLQASGLPLHNEKWETCPGTSKLQAQVLQPCTTESQSALVAARVGGRCLYLRRRDWVRPKTVSRHTLCMPGMYMVPHS